MAKTRISHRIFFLLLAIIFFVTAFTLTFFVIWQGNQSTSSPTTTASNTHLPKCSLKAPPASIVNVKKKGQQLQGTQLVDFTPCQVTKLEYTDVKVGTGPIVTAADTVTVNYTGAVAATGTIFQSSLDTGQPATFPLSGVIQGWSQGIPGMRVGGIRRLFIPASLAYGASPPSGSGIPANADLVFDVTVLSATSSSSSAPAG